MNYFCLQCTTGKVAHQCVNCQTVLALCDPCADEIKQNFCATCYSDGITPVVTEDDPPPLVEAETALVPA